MHNGDCGRRIEGCGLGIAGSDLGTTELPTGGLLIWMIVGLVHYSPDRRLRIAVVGSANWYLRNGRLRIAVLWSADWCLRNALSGSAECGVGAADCGLRTGQRSVPGGIARAHGWPLGVSRAEEPILAYIGISPQFRLLSGQSHALAWRAGGPREWWRSGHLPVEHNPCGVRACGGGDRPQALGQIGAEKIAPRTISHTRSAPRAHIMMIQ